jgi:radical SAM superfamily enzyme YgiQ (UPF0313 family)
MTESRRRIVLAQLPIPPLGPDPTRGNVPLAAAYLKLFAEQERLGESFDIEILPAADANTFGDRALAAAIAGREPWLVGFTCYVWNIERTLWICHELKRRRPQTRIMLGGPEITADNQWVLESPDYDFAAIGEGEQTFAEFLHRERNGPANSRFTLPLLNSAIPGLYVPPASGPRFDPARMPPVRSPMPDINRLGSPYLAGVLDAAEEKMLLLETTRGCVFNCKFCYYPKSYDQQYFLSPELVRAGLRHAVDRGVEEVFLLDPTLNQRKDFADLLRLLAEENRGQQFKYFGELRAEGITERTARLLREANFTEVEVGLQSIGRDAMNLMDRNNNLRAFERGVRAMMAEGIEVKVDLIIGLPGDTAESIRRGMRYLRDGGLYSDVQVFNLAVLPGTAFRQEAEELGLRFQPRPPYYVTRTPALAPADLFGLMQEAQEIFEVDFDAPPPPVLKGFHRDAICRVDLDRSEEFRPPPAECRRQAFTLWVRSRDLGGDGRRIAAMIDRILQENPFTTLQVVLEPSFDADWRGLHAAAFEPIVRACRANPTYLDKFYAMQPGEPRGSRRIVLLLTDESRQLMPPTWIEELEANVGTIARAAKVEFGSV